MRQGPLFLLQIVHVDTGVVAHIPGGGALEADLIELATRHILSKGVSFRTRDHVERDIRDGLKEAIFSMKEQTKFIV